MRLKPIVAVRILASREGDVEFMTGANVPIIPQRRADGCAGFAGVLAWVVAIRRGSVGVMRPRDRPERRTDRPGEVRSWSEPRGRGRCPQRPLASAADVGG
jgi:hypothetical protein